MATIIQGDLIDSVREGRILQVINAQGRFRTGRSARGFGHELFSSYDNLYDDLREQLSDKADENYAETISVTVAPDLVVDNAVVMYESHGQVDENLLVRAILTQAKVAEQDGTTLAIPYGLGSGFGQADWDSVYDRVKHVSNLLVFQLSVEDKDEFDEDDDDEFNVVLEDDDDLSANDGGWSENNEWEGRDEERDTDFPYDDRDDDGSEFE